MPYIPNTVISSGGGAGAVTLISDTLLAVDTASFDITGIPATYKHLEIYAQLRGTQAATVIAVFVRFNNDSGANYSYAYVGTTVANGSAQTATAIGDCPAASATANLAAAIEVSIPNYAGATFVKNLTSKESYSTNTSTHFSNLIAGMWHDTPAAINRITIFPSAANFLAGSRVSLYGIS